MDVENAQKLPRSLEEALHALENDEILKDTLGHRFVSYYIMAKKEYDICPSQRLFKSEKEKLEYEREKYLECLWKQSLEIVDQLEIQNFRNWKINPKANLFGVFFANTNAKDKILLPLYVLDIWIKNTVIIVIVLHQKTWDLGGRST